MNADQTPHLAQLRTRLRWLRIGKNFFRLLTMTALILNVHWVGERMDLGREKFFAVNSAADLPFASLLFVVGFLGFFSINRRCWEVEQRILVESGSEISSSEVSMP